MNKKAIPTTALKRAGDYLAAALGSGAWKPGDRLPSTTALAKLAGVSSVTMWKAISACKAQGKLTAERGRWISAGPPATPAIPPPPFSRGPRRWEMVKQAMNRDILLGRLPLMAGLLNTKELGGRYGCSYRPLRMALAKLVEEGLLQHDRRGFRLLGPRQQGSVVQQAAFVQEYFRKGLDFINDLSLYHILYHRALCARLRPVFEKALAAGGEAAWVGVNDEVALEILRFLEEKDTGSGNPHLGVAGFDNLVEAARMNLTSYDFNDDLANQVLSHLLQPGRFAEKFPAPVVMVQGGVVERQTLNASSAS